MEWQNTSVRAKSRPRLKPICALLLTIMAGWQEVSRAAQADAGATIQLADAGTMQVAQTEFAQVEFESGFLRNGGGAIDVSRYQRGNVVRAGAYSPDIYVDGNWVGRAELPFRSTPNTVDAQPYFDKALLNRIGVDLTRLPADVRAALDEPGTSLRIGQVIPEASVSFDFNNLRLDLSIPQISLQRTARGYVSPDQWSEGVPVAMLGYNVNAYHSRASGQKGGTQGYVGVDGGFNYQRWHFRHNGSFNWDDRGQRKYQSASTYVQRNLAAWSSQLVVGDTYTTGDLFDSTSFRGVRVYTDDRMLPESQRGYAPVVRGVANTNAKVTITQNGVKLYETTVAPGAFVIDDLYPTGYGGDLHVAVTEADGSVRTFSVPYASVPMSLRPGQNRYSFTVGTVRNLTNTKPFFAQATWQRGFTNMLTGFGGVTVAQDYLSAMAGAVLNTSWGAFGVDVTHATTKIPNEQTHSGQSFRISYAKTVAATGTNVAIAAYRYSTNGFFGLNDAMSARDLAKGNVTSEALYRSRNRASLTMSQQLGEKGGSVNVTASTATYWNRKGSNTDFTVGYNNSFRNLSYSVSASRQRDAWGESSTLIYAGLSVPLGSKRPATLSTNFNYDSSGATQVSTNLSGSLGADSNLSYGVNVNHGAGSANAQTNGGANMMYRGSKAELSGSVSASKDYQQYSVGARGAIVAHRGGVTLSLPLSETFAIVEAKHAEGARITNASGVRVDGNGYAIVPYLSPFSMNDVSLDPKGLSTDVELKETSQRVAPLSGAVPMLVFKADYGRSAVIRARQADGAPVPFGAVVTDSDGKDVGVIGQGGKLLARGLAEQGELNVQWEKDEGKGNCKIAYSLPVRKRASGYQPLQSLELPCVAGGAAQYAPPVSKVTTRPAT
ncbi:MULTISPECIES: fimbria/pilus outer membrane usher protein [Burkholderia]|uniref:Fimbrial biogenesis outer membrane usher protein n=1 Tax=Burkholderia contaminans TaxID=488447 RepID=A0A2S5E3U9_9BURK|nr:MULTISPECIES: fimbria/pilus outer membrane usher protein [Burkholderia]EKS9798745.1 fimbrial biogenesis outer membrane usher protein [Burkholderia cepacia]EKS9803163.1 fimbrial biogenesis outer membrane usher protein [Burkholderia cepacia]EKS9810647.1 fimbrial biogenesis outer membrane usher protein [Burkholderia cepacia]EKS9819622.1 fimbrial biogenesis outer membrane usher protein [Burkholderia cepacia]EKS9827240.1 fimbrial biogenesis outer membrane usher protein [Burkholderia cepacia]